MMWRRPEAGLILVGMCLPMAYNCEPLVGLPMVRGNGALGDARHGDVDPGDSVGDPPPGDSPVAAGDASQGDMVSGDSVSGDSVSGDSVSGDSVPPGDQYTPECGNGSLDAGEACDDGNVADGDACDSECQRGVTPVTTPTASDGQNNDDFGSSVSVSGDVLVVGASGHGGGSDMRGAVYVYERAQGGADRWGQVIKLLPTDVPMFGIFGHSVAVDSGTALVGASGAHGAAADSGAAYVFYEAQGWGQIEKLTAADGAAYDSFGVSVSVNGDTAVVGASGRNGGPAALRRSAQLSAAPRCSHSC